LNKVAARRDAQNLQTGAHGALNNHDHYDLYITPYFGQGSQPAEQTAPIEYLQMPQEMTTYSMPDFPRFKWTIWRS
jgi:hypothetical protein